MHWKWLGLALVVAVVGTAVWAVDYLALFQNKDYNRTFVDTDASNSDTDPELLPENVPYRVESVAQNLYVPWDLVFTSENRMLITERDGNIRVWEDGQLVPEPIRVIEDVVENGESGLLSITLHPEYAQNQWLYISYTYPNNEGDLKLKVVRLVDEGSSLRDDMTVIDAIPAAVYHDGSRIRFGPDNKLYITTGDATQENLAQDLSSVAGKILRLNDDGSIPSDNPFPNSAIYSLGHRNPQGIDWHPVSGALYQTEHGPSGNDGPGGGDEVNLIQPGENYGWPLVSHQETDDAFVTPKIVFTPAVAPASGTFYQGDVFPQFQNNFFFGGLRGELIMRVVFNPDNPSQISYYERLPGIDVGRVRTVRPGPDGFLYFTTSNRDGRGSADAQDDQIYRLVPLQ